MLCPPALQAPQRAVVNVGGGKSVCKRLIGQRREPIDAAASGSKRQRLSGCRHHASLSHPSGSIRPINGRVMCLALHPHNIGRPNAAKHLDEALSYILGHDGVWATTADDIAWLADPASGKNAMVLAQVTRRMSAYGDRSPSCFNGLLYNCGLPQIKIVCQQIRGCLPARALSQPRGLRSVARRASVANRL